VTGSADFTFLELVVKIWLYRNYWVITSVN